MTFENLKEGTTCNCLEDSREDTNTTFVRRIGKNKVPKSRDFKPFWGKRLPENPSNCKEVCSLKGVSIDIWNEESKEVLWEKFNITFGIGPKIKKRLCIFKLKKEAGQIKHTPVVQLGRENPFHYDFYKSDPFYSNDYDINDMIELIQIKPL